MGITIPLSDSTITQIKMTMVQVLIWIHAGLGGLALLSGLVAVIAKKGSKPHVLSGLGFFYAMAVSAATALIIAKWPGHESNFLFMLGVFSLYLIIGGKRAVGFKKLTATTKLTFDKVLSLVMILAAVYTLADIAIHGGPLLLTGIFGGIGIAFAIVDLTRWNDWSRLKKGWLKIHLGKMMGGYIAATTAFIVVNGFIPSIWGWLAPSIIGTLFIFYWTSKVSKR